LAKVLVVDDEEHLLLLLEEIIKELGHEVFSAANGKQALLIVERERPQLIFSDVMMPGMDGYTLLKEIRQHPHSASIKVVLISAAPMDRKRQPTADAYIAKPYDLDAIEELVTRFAPGKSGHSQI
jgi:CheY-like chemotaxis protein